MRKPGSTCRRLQKLRTSRPAPTTSSTASATCVTTRIALGPCRRRPAGTLPLSAACMSTSLACVIGTSPKTRPTPSESAAETPRTRPSRPMSARRGMSGGATAINVSSPAPASANPATSASDVSTSPSNRNCGRRRHVSAPSARRTATSRRRVVARASNRLAAFAHATSSTSPTAAINTSKAGRTGPNTTVDSGSTKTPRPSFCGYVCSRSVAMAVSSSRAEARVASGASRPITKMGCVCRGNVSSDA